jgi:hypothetical protein
MTSQIQNAVLTACREFMRPVVRLLLKNGIGYREFSEICKKVFVEVASDDHGIRGRKTNMSRVAVMTGLSRKEVRKLRDATDSDVVASMLRRRRPELILSIWHTDPEYCDSRQRPKRIRFEGPGATFRGLVNRVGGDIPARAMLNELLRAGSVVEEGEKLRLVSQSYVPEPNDPEAILVAGDAIRDLVSTIYHNLGIADPEMRFLEKRVYSVKLPANQRARFRKLARERGELLLRDLNAWINERESAWIDGDDPRAPEVRGPRIGVGVYFFDDSKKLNSAVAPRKDA